MEIDATGSIEFGGHGRAASASPDLGMYIDGNKISMKPDRNKYAFQGLSGQARWASAENALELQIQMEHL